MKIGLVGPSYDQRSLPFNAQRTINLFPIIDNSGAKETASLIGTPGLQEFSDYGAGPIRGMVISGNDRVFFVSGSQFYELDSSGTGTFRGSLFTSEGIVTIAEGTTQLAICDGNKLYSFVYSSNTFAQVTDPDLPSSVGSVTNIGGYFVVNENDTGIFYKSDLNDVTSWYALEFATAENSPDKLLRVINAIGQLLLFGVRTTEVWANTGGSLFQFSLMSGGAIKVGVSSPNSISEIDNTVIWVGHDDHGQGIVYKLDGFTPIRVSTEPIERRIQGVSDISDLYAWSYQEEGHFFYVLTGGDLDCSLVLDLTTGLWHERAYLSSSGNFQQHLGSCHIFAFGKHLVGSRLDGKIYEMSLDLLDDDGDSIARERVYTHIVDEMRRIRQNSLEIGFETGVGLQSGEGANPVVTLEISRDGARTWSDPIEAPIGRIGEYRTRVRFRRLGVSEQTTYRIRFSDNVKVAITGSYLT